jgi:hypothetical protein
MWHTISAVIMTALFVIAAYVVASAPPGPTPPFDQRIIGKQAAH